MSELKREDFICYPPPRAITAHRRGLVGELVAVPAWQCVVCRQRWYADEPQEHRDGCDAVWVVVPPVGGVR